MNKILSAIAKATFAIFISVGTVYAQTPDGETPAEETVCDAEAGAAFGLCSAFCEAMDCGSDSPLASAKACEKVGDNFEKITGGPPPCMCSIPQGCYAASVNVTRSIFWPGGSGPFTVTGYLDDNCVQSFAPFKLVIAPDISTARILFDEQNINCGSGVEQESVQGELPEGCNLYRCETGPA